MLPEVVRRVLDQLDEGDQQTWKEKKVNALLQLKNHYDIDNDLFNKVVLIN